jgi:D-serine deaminase-like pyridoxal phosphate-dependent protein
LQSNKAQDAVAVFDRIQSVDSLKLLRRLDRFAGEQGKKLAILLQCNTGKDPNKYGFAEEELPSVIEVALKMPNLQVDGLMTIAPLDDDPKVAGAAFNESASASRRTFGALCRATARAIHGNDRLISSKPLLLDQLRFVSAPLSMASVSIKSAFRVARRSLALCCERFYTLATAPFLEYVS